MVNQLLIDGDQIHLIGFSAFDKNDTINLSIYGPKKVVISGHIPSLDAQLACHNIVTLRDYKHVDQALVDQLIEVGVTSGTKFVSIRNTYIADIFD